MEFVGTFRQRQSLRVGVDIAELHTGQSHVNHVIHGIRAAAAHTDDLDARGRGSHLNEFELSHFPSPVIT
jgi:hypothetical protein